MTKLFAAVLCIIAIGVTALPAAHGIGHDHGGSSSKMAKGHGHDTDPASTDEPASAEHCDMLPGHCSSVALTYDATAQATHYATRLLSHSLDDGDKPKFRPETELRPPRV